MFQICAHMCIFATGTVQNANWHCIICQLALSKMPTGTVQNAKRNVLFLRPVPSPMVRLQYKEEETTLSKVTSTRTRKQPNSKGAFTTRTKEWSFLLSCLQRRGSYNFPMTQWGRFNLRLRQRDDPLLRHLRTGTCIEKAEKIPTHMPP